MFDQAGEHASRKDLRDVITNKRRTVPVEGQNLNRPASQVEILDGGAPDGNARPGGQDLGTSSVAPAIQAQLDMLAAAVQGLSKRPSGIDAIDHRRGSPFCARIRAAQPPAKYKAPGLPVYTEKADPIRHVEKFKYQMELLGVSDYIVGYCPGMVLEV